jgi:hypothetical protein
MFQAKIDGGWVGSDEQSAEWNWIPEMIWYHVHWGGEERNVGAQVGF